jgi:diguanylate cyclase (GGDEF)-like protein
MSSDSPFDGEVPAGLPSGVVAGFELLGELGRGGRTVTYRVRRASGIYAMKILLWHGGEELPVRAFRREAALLASVNHPGLVRVHEVGVAHGRPYLVMDHVDGRPLSGLLARGGLPVDRLIRVGIDVASALGAAHRARLVHRDIKPDNILISPDGRAHVIDFGLAVRPGDLDEASTAGTLRYSAPEQAGMLHRPVDGRSDLYALGAVLYECAVGQPPFTVRDVGDLLRMQATTPAPDPRASRADLPPALAGVIARLLAKDPDDRYQTAAGLGADLGRIARGDNDFVLGLADQPRARPDWALIGRDPELASLLRVWARAHDGTGGSAALVLGAPGSGKSRLAREVATVARRHGGLVLVAKCEPEEGVPLGPLRRAIEHHLAGIATLTAPDRAAALDRVRAAAGSSASLLRGLSPALDEVLAAPQLSDDDRQLQFGAAVAGFLAGLADAAGGGLLHVEDVQWLDAATRRVVAHLGERLAESRLCVLATGRDGAEYATAIGLMRSAVGGDFERTVTLGPLTTAMVGGLVSAAAGGLAVDDSIAASLTARCDGNAFTLLQYLDALLDGGVLRPDWGRWRLDPDSLHSVALSGSGVELILRRMDGLDPDSRYVLGVGAVHGSTFEGAVVAEACGLTRHRVLEVADGAAWRNVIEPRSGGRYAFLHDQIRAALLGQFDPATLRSVHRRIADALDRTGRTDPGAVFALARHCELGTSDPPSPGDQPERTYRACLAAGRLALADHAPAEALGYLERAAATADRAGIGVDFDLLFLLATAQHRGGRFADAIETAWLGHVRARSPVERARILALAAQAMQTAWRSTEEARLVHQALSELGRTPANGLPMLIVSTLWTFLMGRLCRLSRIGYGTARGVDRELFELEAALCAAGAWACARQLAPARSIMFTLRETYPASRLGSGREEAKLEIGLAFITMSVGLYRLGARSTARAWRAANRVGDPMLTSHVAWVDAFIRHSFGRDQGESLYRVLDEHGEGLELGLRSDVIFILLWDALLRGATREAQQLTDRRYALMKLIGDSGNEDAVRIESGAAARAATACLRAWQDRSEEAGVVLASTPNDAEMLKWERLPVLGAAMVIAYEEHDLGETFDRAVAAFDNLGLPIRMLIPAGWGFYVTRAYGRLEQCRLATGPARAVRLGQAHGAVRLLRRAARTPLLRAHYEVARGWLRLVGGQPKAALSHLAKAEPILIGADAPAVAFEAARVRALALRQLRIRGEANRQAHTALTIAQEHEWGHRTRQLVAEFGLAEPSNPTIRATATTTDTIELGRFRQRLDAIETLSVAASRVLDPAKLAAIALDETIHILGAERAFLFLLDGTPPQLVPRGGRDASGHDLTELVGYSASTVEHVRRTGQPVVITGTEKGATVGTQSVALHGLRSIMVVPMQLDGRLLGIVYLDSRVAKGVFTADDVGVLTALTNHIAVALETARAAQLEVAVATANQQRDLAETVRDALAEITGKLDPEPESVLVRLKQTAAGLIGGGRAWLVLGGPGDATVRILPDETEQPSIVELGPRLAELLGTDVTLIGDSSGIRPELLHPDERSWLAVPMLARGVPVGLLLMTSSRPDAYNDGQADLATALVGQAMVGYENTRLFAQIQQLATTDDLTGIANRRHFFDLAAGELSRSRRDRQGLFAMMVDIDFFKNVNDQYGHQVGDEVIQIVAGRLSRETRGDDQLGRYGGEEFALVLPTGDREPRLVAERLRAAIADAPLLTRAGALSVTVSVGAASLHPDDKDISTLLGRADRRLYEAKRGGRNRVAAD